jgi:hypothetical protein
MEGSPRKRRAKALDPRGWTFASTFMAFPAFLVIVNSRNTKRIPWACQDKLLQNNTFDYKLYLTFPVSSDMLSTGFRKQLKTVANTFS